jgi:hypothetical protein
MHVTLETDDDHKRQLRRSMLLLHKRPSTPKDRKDTDLTEEPLG